MDGTPPLSDHVMLHLPGGGDADVRHLLVHARGRAAAGLRAPRRHRPGRRLVGRAGRAARTHAVAASAGHWSRACSSSRPDGRLRLWAHGDLPAAEKLANALGFTRLRSLWQMRAPLTDPLPEVELPDGITRADVRRRPGRAGLDRPQQPGVRRPPRPGRLEPARGRGARGRAVVRPGRLLPRLPRRASWSASTGRRSTATRRPTCGTPMATTPSTRTSTRRSARSTSSAWTPRCRARAWVRC